MTQNSYTHGRQRSRSNSVEWIFGITVIALGVGFFMILTDRLKEQKRLAHQVSCAKIIIRACAEFANDNNGVFPNGKYNPRLGKIVASEPADTAEACFNDLFESRRIEVELFFWNPRQHVQCWPKQPDEDSNLRGKENCWDYLAGLYNSAPSTLPLVFEASDNGDATTWTEDGGHLWNDVVVVGFADRSVETFGLTGSGHAKIDRGGSERDLCVPTPGIDGWPNTAKFAPATPSI